MKRLCKVVTTALSLTIMTGLTSLVGANDDTSQTKPATLPKDGAADATKATGAEDILKEKGLTKDDRKFLLDENAAIKKYEEAQNAFNKYQQAMMKSSSIAQYDENLLGLDSQRQMAQQQATALQQQINSHGSGGRGRLRSFVNAQIAPLKQAHSAAVNQVNQLNAQHKAMLTQAPKADQRKLASSDLDRTQADYTAAIRGLEPLVTPLISKYHELALDKDVIAALARLKNDTSHSYKLGPSDELKAAAKLLKDLKLTPHTTKAKSAAKKSTKAKNSL
jgi:hypothetical protein